MRCDAKRSGVGRYRCFLDRLAVSSAFHGQGGASPPFCPLESYLCPRHAGSGAPDKDKPRQRVAGALAAAVQRRVVFTRSGGGPAGSEQHDGGEGGGREDERRGTGGADAGVAGGELIAAEVDHAAVRGLQARGLRVLAGVLPAVKKKQENHR